MVHELSHQRERGNRRWSSHNLFQTKIRAEVAEPLGSYPEKGLAMPRDPRDLSEKYLILFVEHVTDMVRNETGKAPTISNPTIRFMDASPVDDPDLSHYSHMRYEIRFNSDVPLPARTIIDIEKWVDVDTCKLLNHSDPDNQYLFEIKALTRS